MLKEQTNTDLHNPKLCDSLPIIPYSNANNCSCINITACHDVTCIKPSKANAIVTTDGTVSLNNSSPSALQGGRHLDGKNGTINANSVLAPATVTGRNNSSNNFNASTVDATEGPIKVQSNWTLTEPEGPKCPRAEFMPANHKVMSFGHL